MTIERPANPSGNERKPDAPQQPQGGRSGEGARSVIPHLRADLRARAAAKISKPRTRDF